MAQPPQAALSAAEGELYRCPPSPLLAAGDQDYDAVVLLAGRLRESLDACRALDDHLIAVATQPPGAAAAAPPSATSH